MNYPFGPAIDFVQNIVHSFESRWPFYAPLQQTSDACFDDFEAQYQKCLLVLSYIFDDEGNVEHQTDKTAELLNQWPSGEDSFISIPAVVSVALKEFDIKDDVLIRSAIMAAVLSEIKNDLPYHNNMHFRKVVIHTLRLIHTHNKIFEDTSSCFNEDQIVSMIIAACIHDLGHRGQGNLFDRKYHFAKTELYSFELAKPSLKECGLSENLLQDIRTMVICTDVSPFGDPISPVRQLRRAFEYHFGSDEKNIDLDLCSDLLVLKQRSDLCLMSMMLHEADIFNSAGMSYESTVQETIAINQEIDQPRALPEETLLFLDVICDAGFLSDSAQVLGQKNLENIRRKVMDDFKSGNKSYM